MYVVLLSYYNVKNNIGEKLMTDKKKVEILLTRNKQLQEENRTLKKENELLHEKIQGELYRKTKDYEKEQKKLIKELTELKAEYQENLHRFVEDKAKYKKIMDEMIKNI